MIDLLLNGPIEFAESNRIAAMIMVFLVGCIGVFLASRYAGLGPYGAIMLSFNPLSLFAICVALFFPIQTIGLLLVIGFLVLLSILSSKEIEQ